MGMMGALEKEWHTMLRKNALDLLCPIVEDLTFEPSTNTFFVTKKAPVVEVVFFGRTCFGYSVATD